MLAGLSAGKSARVRADLGLTPGQELVNAAADVRSHAILLDYRQEALLRLPADGVKGRGSELELMRRFCAGEDVLLIWRADAWSGKSALMAAFALLPCHKVLEAACHVEPSLGTLPEELEPWH